MVTKRQCFRITGYPRSGLAWLSVFLTARDSFCLHEGRKWRTSPETIDRPESVVGDACSGYAVVKQPVDVVVRRPRVHVEQRLNELEGFREHFTPRQIRKLLNACEAGMNKAETEGALVIPFEELFNFNSLCAIWERCTQTGFTPADSRRAFLLARLNIQTDVAKDAAMLGLIDEAHST